MRHRSILFRVLLFCLAAGAGRAQVLISLSSTANTLLPGQSAALTALVTGNANTAVNFGLSPSTFGSLGTPVQGSGGITTVTYRAPTTVASPQTVTITATSAADSSKSQSVTIQVNPAVSVSVSPSAVTLAAGQSQQFSATVTGLNGGVVWSISPQAGFLDQSGFYLAPSTIATTQKITVTATSVSDPSKFDTATISLTATIQIGQGAPDNIAYQFLQAYNRNGFSGLVSLPPLGIAKRLGSSGYVQEFSDAAKTAGVKYALASQNTATTSAFSIQVFQLGPDVYAYYTTVGATTAGYPAMDWQNCPGFDQSNSCSFDFFDKNYALFAYKNSLPGGQTFTIRNNIYIEWTNLGGMSGPGRPIDVETAVTASTKTTATEQDFAGGAIYTITSGANNNKIYGVVEPLYDLYVANQGPAGSLGLPVSDVLVLASGIHRQLFEKGALEYTPGGDPTYRYPVTAVIVSGASATATTTLTLGDTLNLSVQILVANGTSPTDRPVSWSTSNSQVVSIQAGGQSAVVRAVGGGAAAVTATSEGVVSARLNFVVNAPCCQVGEGAPPAIQQSFQSALTRNRIAVQLPVASPAARTGGGYAQMVQSSDPAVSTVYLLAQSDKLGTAFLVSGALLKRYQDLGGPAGTLGYPIADASAGGTQRFENSAALGGNPVRLVSGPVLTKWAQLGYETGAAGDPTGEASDFSTFGANSGVSQSFRNGAILAATAGPRSGQTYFVSGLILARYLALNGPAGDFGMPVSDEFSSGAQRQQNFEGGNLIYTPGDSKAVEHASPRTPAVVVSPASVTAGGRARLAVIGFPNSSVLRVTISGQPDFLVNASSGAYAWDMFVPAAAKSATVTIHAVDTKGAGTADGSLSIRSLSDTRAQISKLQGDNQTGPPGALLPLSLRVALRDSSGAAIAGATVVFQASPGAQVLSATAVSDSNGQAETLVRLPAREGVAAVTADAPSVADNPVTFFLRSAASGLSNFPKLQQSGSAPLGNGTATIGQKGALLTAVAAILRYHQNRGELASPNGAADPETLNGYLKNFCAVDTKGNPVCDGFVANPDSGEQIVNLWRAAGFTGGADVAVENPAVSTVADLVAQGSPALLSLGLSLNGAPAGGHFVVATGIAADGSIAIMDPSPLFARASLNDYLAGFSAAGGNWTADLRGVARFALRTPAATRFLIAALSQPAPVMQNFALDVRSAAGVCGTPLELADSVDAAGNPAAGARISRMQTCDGAQPVYQISLGAAQPYRVFVTDLASGGSPVDLSASAPAAYKAARPQAALTIGPQDAAFTAEGVVNAATFTSGIAPGGIIAIFGSGLSGPASATTVDVDGTPLTLFFASPFQIDAALPAGIAPGTHTLRVRSQYGTAQQTVAVAALAPAIFLVGTPPAGALQNQDYSLNGPSNPAARGRVMMIYATGLGTVVRQGLFSVTTTPVSVVVNGTEIPSTFAGLVSGYVGLYQVNIMIPSSAAPGLGVPLILKQGGALSNTVSAAIQ